MARKDWEGKNYYAILGISPTAGRDEIRAVYRRLAFELHPDRNSDPASQVKFAEVMEAYSVLSDVRTREEYDAYLLDDRPIISMQPLPEGMGFNVDAIYDDIASKVDPRNVKSLRSEYLRHLEKSRRRKAFAETVFAVIVIFLLLRFGFKPLNASSGSVASSITNIVNNNGQAVKGGLDQALIVVKGDQGIRGVAGPAGADGRQGIDGRQGVDGAPGVAGAPGAAGAPGPAGAPGAPGAPGAQGPEGPAGSGVSGIVVTPNFGLTGSAVQACTTDPTDTTTTTSLTAVMVPNFDPTTQKYLLGGIKIGALPPGCSGSSMFVDVLLAAGSDYTENAFECRVTLPTILSTYTQTFSAGGTGCYWKASNNSINIGTISVVDITRLNLALSG